MKGNPVGVVRAASMSPKQYSNAMHIANPRAPLITTEKIMLLGITDEACSISSAKTQQSAAVLLTVI
jgi:hypothetical protein